MRSLLRFFHRLAFWAGGRRDQERLQAEIEEHLACQTADNIRAGLPPDEARRLAVLKFGPVEAMKEDYREARSLPFLETQVRDVRHAWRRLRKSPLFTAATVLILGLGIGATASIFTLVHAIILRSLAVANPQQLYRLGKESRCCYWGGYSQDKEFSLVSYDLYKHFRDHSKGFSELAAFSASQMLFGVRRAGAPDEAQSYPGEFVSGNYFAMFGVGAYAGRTLTPADDRPGAPAVAMMSHRLWRERYGSDPSVIGSIFNLNDKPVTVVGITPPAFFGDTLSANPPDFFLPLNTEPVLLGDSDLYAIDTHWLDVIGRIEPGANPGSIEAGMRLDLRQWLGSHWGEMTANDRAKLPRQTLNLVPGGAGITSMREQYEHWLRILMMVSGLALVIVCANIANLMLLRGMERRQQISLSMALGARPSRLVREALTESIVLALAGGAAGLAIAFAVTRMILHFAFPTATGLAAPITASPSMPVLLFTFGIAVGAGMVFGIAPAWVSARVDPMEALRGANRSTNPTASFFRKVLVVLQAALSLALLSSAGLLTNALLKLENQDFGFTQDRRIVVKINPRLAGYSGPQLTPLYRRIHDAVSSMPDVSAVALCIYSPLGGNNRGAGIWVDGHRPPGPNDNNFAFWNRVTGGYFGVIGSAIVKGRGIVEQDNATSPRVAVVSETFARVFFGNEDPVGKHFGQHGIGSEREYEIVGVTKDARYLTFNLDKPIAPMFFLPEAQHDIAPQTMAKDANPGSHFLGDIVIVTRPGATLPAAQLRRTMASVDPNLPIVSIVTLREQVAGQFRQSRLIARLTSFFGLLSLILSSIGLYGVTAYNAERRVNEIGVRMALGADAGDIVTLVLRGAFLLIAIGLSIGFPLALAAGRALGKQLYGMSPYDPTVMAICVVSLGLPALLASLIPALRASRISPSEALRAE
jgi:predicted permease